MHIYITRKTTYKNKKMYKNVGIRYQLSVPLYQLKLSVKVS